MPSAISIEEFVLTALAETCYLDRATMTHDTTLSDIGVDSLVLTGLVARVEATYEHEISSATVADLMKANSLGEVIDLMSR